MDYNNVSFDPHGLALNNYQSQIITLKNAYREMMYKTIEINEEFVIKMRAMQVAPDRESKIEALNEINQDAFFYAKGYLISLCEKLQNLEFETVVYDLNHFSNKFKYKDLLNPIGLVEPNLMAQYAQVVDAHLFEVGNPELLNGNLFDIMREIEEDEFHDQPIQEDTFVQQILKHFENLYKLILDKFIKDEPMPQDVIDFMNSLEGTLKENLNGKNRILFVNIIRSFATWFSNFSNILIVWRTQFLDIPKNKAFEIIRVQDYIENLEVLPSLADFKDELIDLVGDADRREYYQNNKFNFKIFTAIIGGRPINEWYLDLCIQANPYNISPHEKLTQEQLKICNEYLAFTQQIGYLGNADELVKQIQIMLKYSLLQSAIGTNQPLPIENNTVKVEDLLEKLTEKIEIADEESLNRFKQYYELNKDEFQNDPTNAIIRLMQIKLNEQTAEKDATIRQLDDDLSKTRSSIIDSLKKLAQGTSINVEQAIAEVGDSGDSIKLISDAIVDKKIQQVNKAKEVIEQDIINKKAIRDELDTTISTTVNIEEHTVAKLIYQNIPARQDLEIRDFRRLLLLALQKRFPNFKIPNYDDVECNDFELVGKTIEQWYMIYMKRIERLFSSDNKGFSPEGVYSESNTRKQEELLITDYVNGLLQENKFVDLNEFTIGVLECVSEKQKEYFENFMDDPIINKALFGQKDLDTWYSMYLSALFDTNE